MYRISLRLAAYLLDHSKDFGIKGVEKDPERPFAQTNTDSIGSINPLFVMGSDSNYIVETEYTDSDISPDVSGCWLYKRDELKPADENFEIPQASVDRYCTSQEAMLNIKDCTIELPSPIDKLTCLMIDSLERLFELEPAIKDCLVDCYEHK